jgi:outer membrane receptor protein involved in Fe transport
MTICHRSIAVGSRIGLLSGVAFMSLIGASQVEAQALSASSSEDQSAQSAERPRRVGELEDIVVTARKKTESLINVPVAVSSVTSTQIERYGLSDISSLGSQMPSVSFEKALGSGGGSLTIRGIGSSGIDTGIEQTVATVLDGVQVSRGHFVQEALLDAQQVEVLKGPQALFFGKNSPGGVLSVTAKGPTRTLEISGNAGYEFRSREKILDGAVSGPITDTLGFRIAAHASSMRGWLHNPVEAIANPFAAVPGWPATLPGRSYDYNGRKEIAGRLTLAYTPSSEFDATLRVFGSASQDNGDSSTSEYFHCPGGPNDVPNIAGVPDPFGDCKINNSQAIGAVPPTVAATDKRYRDGKPYGRYTSYLTSLTMNYNAGPVKFTSVTGFVGYIFDHMNSSQNTFTFPMTGWTDHFRQLSEELRVVTDYDSPINFSGGFYLDSSRLRTGQATILVPTPVDPTTGRYAGWSLIGNYDGNSYSAFGQVRWKIVDSLELAGGVRYTYETRDGVVGNDYVNQTPGAFAPNSQNPPQILPLAPQGVFFKTKVKNSNFSPEVTLSWHPIQDTTLYLAYKTGFKSGGISLPTIIPATFDPARDGTYRPEKAKGFELGFKAQLLNRRLRLTGALYRFDYKDLQISNFDSRTVSVSALNVGGARTQGVELEAAYEPIDGLTFNAALGYSRARYRSFPGIAAYAGQPSNSPACTFPIVGSPQDNGQCLVQDLAGQPKGRAPDWSGNLGVNYEVEAFQNYVIGVSGNFRFSSGYFMQENNNPLAYQKSYQAYDATLRLRRTDDRWYVALIGRNLSNARYGLVSLDNPLSPPGTIEATISRPRQVRLEVGFKY